MSKDVMNSQAMETLHECQQFFFNISMTHQLLGHYDKAAYKT